MKKRAVLAALGLFLIVFSFFIVHTNQIKVTVDHRFWQHDVTVQKFRYHRGESGWELPAGAIVIASEQRLDYANKKAWEAPSLKIWYTYDWDEPVDTRTYTYAAVDDGRPVTNTVALAKDEKLTSDFWFYGLILNAGNRKYIFYTDKENWQKYGVGDTVIANVNYFDAVLSLEPAR